MDHALYCAVSVWVHTRTIQASWLIYKHDPHSDSTGVWPHDWCGLGDGSQVLKFVSEACSMCVQSEPHCREPNELQLLWKLLQLLCQHKGDLHSAMTPGVSETRPGESLLIHLQPP